MRILFLTDIPPSTGSWIGRYRPLVTALSRIGHRVTVLQPKDRSATTGFEDATDSGASVSYLKRGYRNSGSDPVAAMTKLMFTAMINLWKMVTKGAIGEFDLILVGKPLPVSAAAATILHILKGLPIHLDCDDYEVFTNHTGSTILRGVIRFFEDRFPMLCRSVTTHNRFLMHRLRETRGSDRGLHFVSNGVDTRRFSRGSRPVRSGRRILYFGDLNLSTGHSVDILIQAFKAMIHRHQCHNVRLSIVGDGKDEPYLRRLADRLGVNKSIDWIGRVPPERIETYIQNSDIVVDPVSFHPGNVTRCPLKILEAMYMGIPVVTSDVGDRRTLLGQYGIYSDVGDAESLADKTGDLLSDKQKRLHIGQKLKERSKNFLWDKLARDFEHILTPYGER